MPAGGVEGDMLRIRIEIVDGRGTKTLAVAEIGNVSDRALVNNYKIEALEFANPVAGNEFWRGEGYIDDHARDQPVWRLVEKAAKFAADAIDNRYVPTAKP